MSHHISHGRLAELVNTAGTTDLERELVTALSQVVELNHQLATITRSNSLMMEESMRKIMAFGVQQAAKNYPTITRDMVSRPSVVEWLEQFSSALQAAPPALEGDFEV